MVSVGLANLPTDTFDFDQEAMKFTQTNVLGLFNADGKQIKQVHARDSHIDFANPKITEMEFDNFMNRWGTGADGRIYAVPVLKDYAINVWGPDGELDPPALKDIDLTVEPGERIGILGATGAVLCR